MVSDKRVSKRDKLTDKELLFIEQYFLCNLNGTEAALAVYDTTDRSSASSIASENLRKLDIRARINARLDEFHLNADEVLARLAYHARGSMEDFIDPHSGVIDLVKAKQAKQLGLIKRYKTKFTTYTSKDGDETETTEVEIELYDAQAALVHVGKHLNLFSADMNINLNLTALTDDQLIALASGKKVIDITASK